MFQKDKWPFTPVRLSEIIDKETLAVIEAGCCERLGRAMTIIDANQQTEEVNRIDSINLRQHYEGFCALLRNETHVRGGNDACEEYDTKVAAKICIIQRIAEAEYERLKNLWEQEFLDSLRTFDNAIDILTLDQLRQYTGKILKLIQDFCRCEYVLFLGSVQEADTVLAPIAEVGLPPAITKKLPHFNWKKAGLAVEHTGPSGWGGAADHRAALKGIRGDTSQFFAQASCVLPANLGHHYRGVLVLGPFAEPVNFQAERRFLMEITGTIGGHILTELEVLYLRQERRRWESTAKLLIHQLRTSLTPITTQVASARLLVQGNGSEALKEITDSLKRAEDLCLRLGRSARETVEAHVLLLEPEDLEFEKFPLSVLVANCVDGFAFEAEKRHRQLVIDPGVELLPEAEVDVARLTIALNNLIENALKYSFPGTKIHVRSMIEAPGDLELAAAVIEIDDLGDAVRLEDQERIFEQGARGLTRAKMGRIPGSGLGLWETRAVVAAHRGTISVVSEPTAIYRPQGHAHHVVFSVKIPLRQPQGK